MSDGRSDQGMSRNIEQQLDWIETMIQEGRQTTEYWGWNFVLWGVAYLVAVFWSTSLTNSKAAYWAWPVMMTLAGFLTWAIAAARAKGKPVTMKTRALTSIWTAIGAGILIFAFPAIIAHRFGDGHVFIAAIEVLLGAAHMASGSCLRWRVQQFVGFIWWIAALISLFTATGTGTLIPFVVATFLCNIGFGVYLMFREARDKARTRAGSVAHA